MCSTVGYGVLAVCAPLEAAVHRLQHATEQVRRDAWNAHERSHILTGRWVKHTRWSLLKAPERQTVNQLATLYEVQQANRGSTAPSCCAKSSGCSTTSTTRCSRPRSSTPGSHGRRAPGSGRSSRFARTLRSHRAGILAAIRLGLSNGRLEGLNSKIGLISHRSYGFHSADALNALVYLCCTGIVIELPR